MDETQTLAMQALRELLHNPERDDWDELVAANRALFGKIFSDNSSVPSRHWPARRDRSY